ncbi:AI-2E family transporter, partial [Streptomyces xiaopingdaonensis]|uniref:AI-2E family transporter n=1 Tax=Streptomyces xiaopingdaonensis TaxID=1565415 RepID=UPI000371D2D0
MPEWLPRAMVVALLLVGLYQLLDWAIRRTLGLLLDVLVSFFLALAMEPAVDRLAARGMRRGPATALVFLALLIAAAGFVTALGSVFVDQVTRIVHSFPEYVESVLHWVNSTFGTELNTRRLRSDLVESDWVRRRLSESARNVWGISATLLGDLFQLLTICLFTFYFAADGPRLRRALCSLLPPRRQEDVLRAWQIAVAKTGG